LPPLPLLLAVRKKKLLHPLPHLLLHPLHLLLTHLHLPLPLQTHLLPSNFLLATKKPPSGGFFVAACTA
jgi:hypothetical protein